MQRVIRTVQGSRGQIDEQSILRCAYEYHWGNQFLIGALLPLFQRTEPGEHIGSLLLGESLQQTFGHQAG